MATRKKLATPDYVDDFDMILIGISSGQKDFKLCHLINQKLELDFARTEDYKLNLGRNNSTADFARFIFKNEDGLTFVFLSNRSNEHFILPELKNIDYLFLILPSGNIDAQIILKSLQEVESIQSVFKLDVLKLKSRFNLLF